jgi:hypothetical protein
LRDEFVYYSLAIILARTANPNYTDRDCQIRAEQTPVATLHDAHRHASYRGNPT